MSIRDLAPNPHVVTNDASNVDLPQESDVSSDISDARDVIVGDKKVHKSNKF